MGQAESSPNLDYLLDDKQEKLIQQYSGVEIDSIHSENTLGNKPFEIKKEKHYISKINSESQSKYQNDKGQETISDPAGFVSHVNDRLTESNPSTEIKDSSDFNSTSPSRKISRDFEFLKEHNSSSEKIFEEYAEYANVLLNAPYNLTTKYTSLETVSSKNNQDIISSLDYNINGSTVDSINDTTVNVKSKDYNSPISDIKVSTTYTNVSLSKPTNVKVISSTDNENYKHFGSKVDLIKQQFEKQYNVRTEHHNTTHSGKCLIEQGNIASEKSNKNCDINSIDQLHEPLSKKNAVVVDVGGDLNTHSKCDSVYVNSHLSSNFKLHTSSIHNQKNEESTISPSYKFNTNSPQVNLGVPNVSTIKTVIDSKVFTHNIKENDKRVSNNGLVYNGKPNIEKTFSESFVNKSTIDIPENKPKVASLRQKFEKAIENDILKGSIKYCNNQSFNHVKKNSIPIIEDLERKKYPLVKSKSDGQIKFSLKDSTPIKRNLNSIDSDGLYEEYSLRTSHRKKNENSTKSAVNSDSIKGFSRKPENTGTVYEDYALDNTKLDLQTQDINLKTNLTETSSPKHRNKVVRNRSHIHNSSRQVGSCIEVFYDDCVVVEAQKDNNKEKTASQVKKIDLAKLHQEKSMDFRRSKKESKRHRRKSDSSTSNLSDSSTPVTKSSKKWKKSKENKDKSKTKHFKSDDNEDTGLSQQWGSMITEYQEKYVSNDSDNKRRFRNSDRRSNKLSNMEQYNNVKQVFNRGMVLPIKRAPPGMSAQEIESDSGVTDYSTHSWTAMHHPIGIRAHNDGATYTSQDGETYIKQRLDNSLSSPVGIHREARIQPSRTRFSSQSSQYTSDATLSPGRQRKGFNDINNHVQKQQNIGYNEISSGHRGVSRHSSSYSDRPITPEAYHHSRLTRHHSDHPSSPEGLRRMKLVKQTISHSSDGAMSPTVGRKFRGKSLPREPYIEVDDGRYHFGERSMSRENLDYGIGGKHYEYSHSLGRPNINHHVVEYASNSLGRPQQYNQSHARSLSRDRLRNRGVQRNIQKRSMSSDRLDHIRPISPSNERRLKERSYSHDYLEPADNEMVHYEYRKKKSKKKTIDEKAKKFVDNVIDEAIDRFTLSPKSKRKSKSKDNLSLKTNQRNIVNTTNIYNEYIEDDTNLHDEERMLDRKAYSDFEDYKMYDDRQRFDNFENDLRRWNSNQRLKPSLLRPQPIDNSLKSERRACIRPIAGSGVTRDGNIPPPKSAYKNYDFELSVGPFQYSGEEKQKKEKKMHNHYSSESEYSATVDHRRRHPTSSQYPHISFGPSKAKSEENLLSENKRSYAIKPQKHSVRIKKTTVNENMFLDNGGFESEPEDRNKYNPPTLTRGMVTKIMHKLDEDVNRLSIQGKSKKRQPLHLEVTDQFHEHVTNTWPRNENGFMKPDIDVSPVGAALFSPLPNSSTNSFYVQSNHTHTGPTSTSSPVQFSKNVQNSHASRNLNQQEANNVLRNHSLNAEGAQTQPIILYEEPKHQTEMSNVGHARFKMFHGEQNRMQQNKDVQSLSMQLGNETKSTDIPKITVDERDSRYGAFSNEQMIVADLVENQGIKIPDMEHKNKMYEVRKVGHLFGTKPDVSMNKQQTLNFYLFNQAKSVDEVDSATSPKISYMARNVEYSNHGQKQQQQTDFFINEDVLNDSDTELREYLIHHKQTQTPNIPKTQKHKKREKKQYIPVYRSPPPQRQSRKHVETTHYITQEREIEKVPQQRHMKEMSIQTDKEEHAQVQYIQQPVHTVGKISAPREQEYVKENVVSQSSFFSRPIITESRHMEKHNYEPPSEDSSPEPTPLPSPPVPQKNIPVMLQQNWNDQFMEKIEHEYQQQHNMVPVEVESHNMEVAVKSDDEETVILETTEIEEREQRIAMAIFEEVEFSATRTEGGKTVPLEGISDIPKFWEPGKFEAVVDRKKKKLTQVKETSQEHGGKRTKQPTDRLAISDCQNDSDVHYANYTDQEKKPMSIEEQKSFNKQSKHDMSEEVTEKIAALDQVLEDELAKDEQAVEETDVIKKNVKSNTKTTQGGEPITENYVNYEKVVDLTNGKSHTIPNPPKYGDMFKSSKNMSMSPNSKNRKATSTFRPQSQVSSSNAWKYSYDPPHRSPTLSQRIKKVKSSYQHTPLEPLFVTERGEMYGRTGRINHHPGISVESETDPKNISFEKMTNYEIKDSKESNMHPETIRQKKMVTPPTPPPVSVLNGQTVHSEQTQPVQQVHYKKDEDGNLLKVTEWQHKLTKTVEYPEEEEIKRNLSMKKQTQKSQSIDELPEAEYIKMNLHETVSSSERPSEIETETNEESESVYNVKGAVNSTGPEVVEETEVGVKPFHYESKQNTLKVEDDPEMSKERQFLYDIKKAKLKPVPKAYKNGWGRKFTYGTMSTHL